MTSKAHIVAFAVLTIAAGSPALAQTAAPAGQFISNATPGEWRASKLVGVSIYGPNDESIGKVDELLIDGSGTAKAVVVGVGGFLGIGKKDVGIPFSAVKWSDKPVAPRAPAPGTTAPGAAPATGAAPAPAPVATTPPAATTAASPAVYDYPDHGSVSFTKDQLKAAPDFHYASEKK